MSGQLHVPVALPACGEAWYTVKKKLRPKSYSDEDKDRFS
jgi:hypothetical protein